METNEKFSYTKSEYPGYTNNYKIECINANKEPVGYVWFEPTPKVYHLHYLSVKKEYRAQGIGSTLLKKLETLAKKHNVWRIEGRFAPEEDNDINMRDFYEKRGYFVPNKERSWATRDETWTMYKDLAPTVKPKPTFENERAR